MASLSVLIGVSTIAGALAQCYRPDLAPEHKPEYVKTALPHTYTSAAQLPESFDWRFVDGKNWLTPLLNQHIPVYCGGCWLHGATAVLNDRLKIARKATGPDVMLARQVVLNCGADEDSDHYAGSCQGGTDTGVYKYMMTQGMPDETCQQYDATDHECSPYRTCMNCDNAKSLHPKQPMCYPVTRYGKYFATEWGPVPDAASTGNSYVHNMKAEVFRRGPITCGIDSESLEQGRYNRGQIVANTVRIQDGKPWETDHVISVVGWGVEYDIEYWIVRNSWGAYWGEDGFVKVATGKNVMNIETDCNWVVIGAEPVTEHYGPSDSDRLFPSADVPALAPSGYQQVLTSTFLREDVATFIRRLNVSEDLGFDYDAPIIFQLAAQPPTTFSGLVEALQQSPEGARHSSHIGGIALLCIASAVLAIGAVCCLVGRRRLQRMQAAFWSQRAPLAPAQSEA